MTKKTVRCHKEIFTLVISCNVIYYNLAYVPGPTNRSSKYIRYRTFQVESVPLQPALSA